KNFKAPREYWKLLLRVDEGKLHATALVADQSPLIDYLPELLWNVAGLETDGFAFEKVAKYQVSVAELQRRTKLKFGADVLAADTFVPGAGEEVRKRRVESVEDVSLTLPRSRPRRRRRAR